MPTIAVLAELLVVGLQSLAWLYLGIALVFGADRLDLAFIERYQEAALLALVALSYTTGVVVDRIADSVSMGLSKAIARVRGGTVEEPGKDGRDRSFPEMRLMMLTAGGGIAEYLGYMRSRLRIARSTAFNLAITCVLLAAHALGLGQGVRILSDTAMAALAFVGACYVAAAWATRRIGATYDKRLVESNRLLRDQ